MELERQKAYVERLPNGVEIGTRHDPQCSQPWDMPQPDIAISEHSLEAVEEACNVATIAVERQYPWYMRALWVLERWPFARRWLKRLRLFRRRPYQYKDPVTHRADPECCRWLCFITVPAPADILTAAVAAEKYLHDRGYQIVEKF